MIVALDLGSGSVDNTLRRIQFRGCTDTITFNGYTGDFELIDSDNLSGDGGVKAGSTIGTGGHVYERNSVNVAFVDDAGTTLTTIRALVYQTSSEGDTAYGAEMITTYPERLALRTTRDVDNDITPISAGNFSIRARHYDYLPKDVEFVPGSKGFEPTLVMFDDNFTVLSAAAAAALVGVALDKGNKELELTGRANSAFYNTIASPGNFDQRSASTHNYGTSIDLSGGAKVIREMSIMYKESGTVTGGTAIGEVYTGAINGTDTATLIATSNETYNLVDLQDGDILRFSFPDHAPTANADVAVVMTTTPTGGGNSGGRYNNVTIDPNGHRISKIGAGNWVETTSTDAIQVIYTADDFPITPSELYDKLKSLLDDSGNMDVPELFATTDGNNYLMPASWTLVDQQQLDLSGGQVVVGKYVPITITGIVSGTECAVVKDPFGTPVVIGSVNSNGSSVTLTTTYTPATTVAIRARKFGWNPFVAITTLPASGGSFDASTQFTDDVAL